MGGWNKNVSIYGNLNKLIGCGVLLSIPVILFGIYLWSRYLAARIMVCVVLVLIGFALFVMLLKWVSRVTGVRVPKINRRDHNHRNRY